MGFFDFFSKKKVPANAASSAVQTLSWRVTKLISETPSTISFEVDGTMSFQAGQFVLLRPSPLLPWRAYSFSRAPGRPLRLTVKRVQGGQVSTHLTTTLKEGDTLEVKGPYGLFVLPPKCTRALFIAGGSGVTPFISMLQEQAAKGWPFPVTLLDFNRNASEQILRVELDSLVAGSSGKLNVVHVLDDGPPNLKGPPSKELFASLFASQATPDVVAMCGPQPMMDLTREVAEAKFPQATFLEEKFSVIHDDGTNKPTHQITLMLDGKAKPFPVKEGEHLLNAARKAGLNMASGCEMGACGVCRVKVLAGKIDLPTDACLSDGEKAQGYALVCVGTTKGDCKIEPAP